MFDCHAHPGVPTDKAFVCTASTEDLGSLSPFPFRAAGSLPGRAAPDWGLFREAVASGCQVGEVGLDKRFPDLPGQIAVLEKALSIAEEYDRVVVLHTVRAYAETYEVIKDCKLRFLLHGWTGSYELAERFLSLGCLISLSPRAERTKAFPRLLSLPFVTETDMSTGPEQALNLSLWNARLSELTGIDTAERSERMVMEWL